MSTAYDFLLLGLSAGALAVGFVAALALAAFVCWLLLILGVIIRDQYDRWTDS